MKKHKPVDFFSSSLPVPAWLRGILILCLLAGIHDQGRAQGIFPPDATKKKIQGTKIENDIKIDGLLDEKEWSLARSIGSFIVMDPVQGAVPRKKTDVRILYNRNYLYVSAICYDTVGADRYRVQNLKRDYSAANSDFFAVAIDGYNDERNSVMFGVNPYGVQRDLLSFDDNYHDPDWDGLWIVRTQRTDTAWVAEIAIPWKTLRYKNSPDGLQTWGISFARIARSVNESSAWPAFPRAYGGLRMPYAGKITDLPAPKPSTNLRLQPYVLYSHDVSEIDGEGILRKDRFKPGGDIKWAVSPNLLLDLTFNTDFAQADVDRKVNNINRFSVFFPERRQFFLENAGLFSTGIQPLGYEQSDYSARIEPFFSRTIGLGRDGRPQDIAAGTRLVYRSDKRNIGGLFIRQNGDDLNGAANFFLGRYSQNLGKQNRIGGLFSYKSVEAKGQEAARGNFTGTMDGFFRFGQGVSESIMASLTSNEHGSSGYSVASQLQYNSNTWVGWWNESIVSRDYDPQMGFVARGNTLISDPGLFYQARGKWLPAFIRTFSPGLAITTYHNATSLELTDSYLNLNPVSFQLQNGGSFSYSAVITGQHLEEDFSPLGTAIEKGDYNYTRHKISFSTDQSKRISATLTGNLGGYYNGRYNSAQMGIGFSPSPHFFFSPQLEIGKLQSVGIERSTRKVSLYTLEARAALNPRVQLSGFFQKSDIDWSLNWNARFSWEFRPLSYFYIVRNNGRTDEQYRTVNRQTITKISYLRQF